MTTLTKIKNRSEIRPYVNGDDVIAIQLTGINFYPLMSEETLAFNATLEILFDRVLYKYECKNEGHGGCTDITPLCDTHFQNELFKEHCVVERAVEAFLNKQRDDTYYAVAKMYGWHVNENKFVGKTLEGEINSLLGEWCDKYGL